MRGLKLHGSSASLLNLWSHPSRVRGLKFIIPVHLQAERLVAPLAGAWIEIHLSPRSIIYPGVAPLAGAWIEISGIFNAMFPFLVAPLAGAWIEIACSVAVTSSMSSHPSRVRGLKCLKAAGDKICHAVAPLAGAWIEITLRLAG